MNCSTDEWGSRSRLRRGWRGLSRRRCVRVGALERFFLSRCRTVPCGLSLGQGSLLPFSMYLWRSCGCSRGSRDQRGWCYERGDDFNDCTIGSLGRDRMRAYTSRSTRPRALYFFCTSHDFPYYSALASCVDTTFTITFVTTSTPWTLSWE